jgi:predicted RNA binding protein YcfA (HicA-like mRNA interferase family)
MRYHYRVSIKELGNPKNVKFRDLLRICEQYFGECRVTGSHHIFKTPWQGDPFVNLQKTKDGKAKPYQVRQVIRAIEYFEELKKKEDKNGKVKK